MGLVSFKKSRPKCNFFEDNVKRDLKSMQNFCNPSDRQPLVNENRTMGSYTGIRIECSEIAR